MSNAGVQSFTLQELIKYTASAPNLSRAPHAHEYTLLIPDARLKNNA